MNTKLSIIVPVYNEGSTVGQLLDSVWQKNIIHIFKEIIIIESNSSDDSRKIVENFTLNKNKLSPGSVLLILQDKPGGKGKAVREGLKAATGDIILIQDADLEYDVEDYPALIQPILRGDTNFVLGSRHLSASGWKIRNFGKNQFRSRFMNLGGLIFHGFFNLIFGTKLTDPTTMYKVFKRTCLKDFDLVSNRFDFDFELLGKLVRSGNRPIEIPVSYVSRGFEDGKKIRIFRDPLTWVWAILKFRMCSMKLTNRDTLPTSVKGELFQPGTENLNINLSGIADKTAPFSNSEINQ
jgi:glycosyltransferase involved in cell wall biosynthesis